MKRYLLLALVVTLAFGTAGCMTTASKTASDAGDTVGEFGSDVAEGAGNLWDRLTGNRITLQIPNGTPPAEVAMVHECATKLNVLRERQGLTKITLIEPEDRTKEVKAAGAGVGGAALGAAAVAPAGAGVLAGGLAVGLMQPFLLKNKQESDQAKVHMDLCIEGARQRARRTQ